MTTDETLSIDQRLSSMEPPRPAVRPPHGPTREGVRISIPYDDLTIDMRVQRAEGVDQRRVARMAAAFDPQALGQIRVSERDDGTRIILDGAHRVAAARLAGYAGLIPATIHFDLTLEQEAQLFLTLNNFKAPSGISRFLARVVAGDPVAVGITRVVEAHGWRVAKGSTSATIAAVAALERVYTDGGGTLTRGEYPRLLDQVLEVLTASWGHDCDAATQSLIVGVGQLYGRFGDAVDIKKLVTELQLTRPNRLLGNANSLRGLQGGTVPAAVAKILTGMVNKGRRNNLLPEWVWIK